MRLQMSLHIMVQGHQWVTSCVDLKVKGYFDDLLRLSMGRNAVWLIRRHIQNGRRDLGTMGAVTTTSHKHYKDVIMGVIASQITSLTIVYSTVYSDADQRKHQSSASLAFVRGIHRRPVNSPHKWPVTRKMFPVDDVIMK